LPHAFDELHKRILKHQADLLPTTRFDLLADRPVEPCAKRHALAPGSRHCSISSFQRNAANCPRCGSFLQSGITFHITNNAMIRNSLPSRGKPGITKGLHQKGYALFACGASICSHKHVPVGKLYSQNRTISGKNPHKP
jgi:hypothetical protein